MKNLRDNLDLFDSHLQDRRRYGIKKINGKWQAYYYFPKQTIIKVEDIKNKKEFQDYIEDFIKDYIIYEFYKAKLSDGNYFLFVDAGYTIKFLFKFVDKSIVIVLLNFNSGGGHDMFKFDFHEVDLLISHIPYLNIIDKLKLKEIFQMKINEQMGGILHF